MSQERSLDHFVDKLEGRARAARAVSIAITIGVVVIGALTVVFTIRQIRRQINEEQAKLAVVQQETADAQAKLEDLKKEYALTRDQFDVSRNALNQLPTEQRDALIKKGEEITKDQIARSEPSVPNVYLQILDNNQRAQANNIASKLKGSGFKVQGVEWVRIPVNVRQTQVKYFRPEFADEAQGIVGLLRQSGIQATSVALNASAGQIEVWFSPDAFPSNPQPAPTPHPTPGNANQTISKLREMLAGSSSQAEEARRALQRILRELEREPAAVPFLKATNVSSADTDGARMVNGLINLRIKVQQTTPVDHALLNRINQVIVTFGN